jgi:phage baseplate assembly protein W
VPNYAPLKDLKINFMPHPVTGDLQVTKEDAAVKQSVVNLLMTIPGERPFQSRLGSRISELLFEPLDYGIAAQIQDEIRTTLRNYEPRIGIVQLKVEPEYDQNSFTVHMEYEIVGRQDNAPQEINFLLQRTQ